jgi:hypothetical protein
VRKRTIHPYYQPVAKERPPKLMDAVDFAAVRLRALALEYAPPVSQRR